MKKKFLLWVVIVLWLVVFVFPYATVEILSVNSENKLQAFDISCFDNVYCKGTPKIYDCKIYAYRKNQSAKVLYILGDCEFGVMVDLEWNHTNQSWNLVEGKNMWSIYGGSAQEFCWPLYYADKVFPVQR